jgi:exonuclease III
MLNYPPDQGQIKHVNLTNNQVNQNTKLNRERNQPTKSTANRQKINKDILELNDTINQLDLINFYRIFQPTTTQYTFFSAVHETFFKIDYILGHKTSLSKNQKIEITPPILSDHKALKLELNNKNSKIHAIRC